MTWQVIQRCSALADAEKLAAAFAAADPEGTYAATTLAKDEESPEWAAGLRYGVVRSVVLPPTVPLPAESPFA